MNFILEWEMVVRQNFCSRKSRKGSIFQWGESYGDLYKLYNDIPVSQGVYGGLYTNGVLLLYSK